MFESQNKRLQEQIRVFEDTNDKRSKLQSSHSKLSQHAMYLESRESVKVSAAGSGLRDSGREEQRFLMKLGSQESKTRTHSGYAYNGDI